MSDTDSSDRLPLEMSECKGLGDFKEYYKRLLSREDWDAGRLSPNDANDALMAFSLEIFQRVNPTHDSIEQADILLLAWRAAKLVLERMQLLEARFVCTVLALVHDVYVEHSMRNMPQYKPSKLFKKENCITPFCKSRNHEIKDWVLSVFFVIFPEMKGEEVGMPRLVSGISSRWVVGLRECVYMQVMTESSVASQSAVDSSGRFYTNLTRRLLSEFLSSRLLNGRTEGTIDQKVECFMRTLVRPSDIESRRSADQIKSIGVQIQARNETAQLCERNENDVVMRSALEEFDRVLNGDRSATVDHSANESTLLQSWQWAQSVLNSTEFPEAAFICAVLALVYRCRVRHLPQEGQEKLGQALRQPCYESSIGLFLQCEAGIRNWVLMSLFGTLSQFSNVATTRPSAANVTEIWLFKMQTILYQNMMNDSTGFICELLTQFLQSKLLKSDASEAVKSLQDELWKTLLAGHDDDGARLPSVGPS